MKLVMCAVLDTKVDAFLQPFSAKTRGEAVRFFTDACKDERGPFIKHLSDFRLFALGTYEDSTGLLTAHQPELLLGGDQIE